MKHSPCVSFSVRNINTDRILNIRGNDVLTMNNLLLTRLIKQVLFLKERMKHMSIILLIQLVLSCSIVCPDFYPIGGYRCEQIRQADSCYLNMALFYGGVFGAARLDSVETLLNLADKLGMRVILTRAQRPHTSDITYMSRGRRFVYESESDFTHPLGLEIRESEADNHLSWAVRSSRAGLFQHGLWTNEQKQSYEDSLTYYALFRLKIDNPTGNDPICSLLVRRKENNMIVRQAFRVLTAQDFSGISVYDTFALKFRLVKDNGPVDYAIWYTGTKTRLYCDHVEVMDTIAYALRTGLFDADITTIATHYNKKNALYRYYMWDEPHVSQFWAGGEVNRLLKQQNKHRGGIQAVCSKNLLQTYLDEANTDELFIDYYPLNGGACAYDFHYVPVDSGLEFQGRIDDMCDFLGEARKAVYSHPEKRLWFIPQTFGQGLSDRDSTWLSWWNTAWLQDSASTGWWREPSPREMRCMVWLALAYGVKGICYYIYHSSHHYFSMPRWSHYVWDVGLTNSSGNIKRPIWNTVKSINAELRSIGSQLIVLTSDTVFKSEHIPPTCFIKAVSDNLVQIGTFHDRSDNYFIIVNRHCLPEDSRDVVVGINKQNLQYLRDCHTQEIIYPMEKIELAQVLDFKIRLTPGQGRLFHLHP